MDHSGDAGKTTTAHGQDGKGGNAMNDHSERDLSL